MLSTINKVLFYLVALFIIFPYKVSAQHQDTVFRSVEQPKTTRNTQA